MIMCRRCPAGGLENNINILYWDYFIRIMSGAPTLGYFTDDLISWSGLVNFENFIND